MIEVFQGANKLFLLSFNDDDGQKSYIPCYLPTVEIKDGRKIFDWPIKNYLRTYDSMRNFTTGQSDYTIGFLLDYLCFKNYYKLIAIALSRPQKLYPDPKTIQQIECTGNL